MKREFSGWVSILMVFVGVSLVPEASRAQGTMTFIDNSAAPVNATVTFGVNYKNVAQEITSPGDSDYIIRRVTLWGVGDYPPGTEFTGKLSVNLFSADSGGLPNADLGLIGTTTLATNASSFSAIPASNLTLSKNTSYYIVLSTSFFAQTPEMFWSTTTSTDSSGLGSLGSFAYYDTAPGLTPWKLMPGNFGLITVDVSPVPEPTTFTFIGIGIAAILLRRSR